MRVMGGARMRPISVARSGLSPFCQADSRIVVSRMCSRSDRFRIDASHRQKASTPSSARARNQLEVVERRLLKTTSSTDTGSPCSAAGWYYTVNSATSLRRWMRAPSRPLREAFLPTPAWSTANAAMSFPARRVVFVDPRTEVVRAQVREGQRQVRQIAFRIDDDDGDGVDGSFFDHRNEARFVAARHADAQRVRDEIL